MTEDEIWKEMGIRPENYGELPDEIKQIWINDIEEGIKLIAIFATVFGAIFLFLVMCS